MGFWGSVGNFFTDTLPGAVQTVLDPMGLFGGEMLPGLDMIFGGGGGGDAAQSAKLFTAMRHQPDPAAFKDPNFARTQMANDLMAQYMDRGTPMVGVGQAGLGGTAGTSAQSQALANPSQPSIQPLVEQPRQQSNPGGAAAAKQQKAKETVGAMISGGGFGILGPSGYAAIQDKKFYGGMVTGGIAGRDSVPTWLAPGEFVVPEEDAKRFTGISGSQAAQQPIGSAPPAPTPQPAPAPGPLIQTTQSPGLMNTGIAGGLVGYTPNPGTTGGSPIPMPGGFKPSQPQIDLDSWRQLPSREVLMQAKADQNIMGKIGGLQHLPWAFAQQEAETESSPEGGNVGTQIDTSGSDEFREDQSGLIEDLQAQASGEGGPSVAELEAQRQRDLGIQQAMGLAASQSGVSPGAALRSAQQAATAQGIEAQQIGGKIRAEEIRSAQQQLGQMIGQARGQDIGLETGQAGLEQQARLANQQAALQQQQMNDQMVQYFMSAGMSMAEANRQADIAMQQMSADQAAAAMNATAGLTSAQTQASAQSKGAGLGALASIAGVAIAAFSDERLKEDTKKSDKDIDQFMDALSNYSYKYKDPKHGGKGRKYGVMAQDLERSPVGKSFVKDTPEGKLVDYGQGFGAVLSGVARLNERLAKLEKKGGK